MSGLFTGVKRQDMEAEHRIQQDSRAFIRINDMKPCTQLAAHPGLHRHPRIQFGPPPEPDHASAIKYTQIRTKIHLLQAGAS